MWCWAICFDAIIDVPTVRIKEKNWCLFQPIGFSVHASSETVLRHIDLHEQTPTKPTNVSRSSLFPVPTLSVPTFRAGQPAPGFFSQRLRDQKGATLVWICRLGGPSMPFWGQTSEPRTMDDLMIPDAWNHAATCHIDVTSPMGRKTTSPPTLTCELSMSAPHDPSTYEGCQRVNKPPQKKLGERPVSVFHGLSSGRHP